MPDVGIAFDLCRSVVPPTVRTRLDDRPQLTRRRLRADDEKVGAHFSLHSSTELFTDYYPLAITDFDLPDFVEDGSIKRNHFRIVDLVQVQIVQNPLLLLHQHFLGRCATNPVQRSAAIVQRYGRVATTDFRRWRHG